jgi:hypothetical protein
MEILDGPNGDSSTGVDIYREDAKRALTRQLDHHPAKFFQQSGQVGFPHAAEAPIFMRARTKASGVSRTKRICVISRAITTLHSYTGAEGAKNHHRAVLSNAY